ncbi:MAG: hypothetical protein J1G30_04720 [Spirochaetales bacterium]|nr:hypothetical protein [Spirochaetales bacterium]
MEVIKLFKQLELRDLEKENWNIIISINKAKKEASIVAIQNYGVITAFNEKSYAFKNGLNMIQYYCDAGYRLTRSNEVIDKAFKLIRSTQSLPLL